MKFRNSRINGYALIMFFVGMFINSKFGEKALIVAVPIFLLWLFKYDLLSYERSVRKNKKRINDKGANI